MFHKQNPNMRSDILLRSGEYFDFEHPDQSNFTIEDIAHALGNICRFNGHTNNFYSVAQHSIYVSKIVPEEYALEGLLHDAAEAFIGDVARPLKNLLPDYKLIENHIEEAVFNRFGISLPLPKEVKEADIVMLATEQRDLMAEHENDWILTRDIEPMSQTIVPVSPKIAAHMFLVRHDDILQTRNIKKA